jgi:hypothetical protein
VDALIDAVGGMPHGDRRGSRPNQRLPVGRSLGNRFFILLVRFLQVRAHDLFPATESNTPLLDMSPLIARAEIETELSLQALRNFRITELSTLSPAGPGDSKLRTLATVTAY